MEEVAAASGAPFLRRVVVHADGAGRAARWPRDLELARVLYNNGAAVRAVAGEEPIATIIIGRRGPGLALESYERAVLDDDNFVVLAVARVDTEAAEAAEAEEPIQVVEDRDLDVAHGDGVGGHGAAGDAPGAGERVVKRARTLDASPHDAGK